MSWNNFINKPESIADINRENFNVPGTVKKVFCIIGASLGGALLGVAADLAMCLLVCFFSCGDIDSKTDQVVTVLLILFIIIGFLIGGIAAYIELAQETNKIESELRLVRNYHLYYCRWAFWDIVVSEAIGKSAPGNTDPTFVRMNFYERISGFVSDYIRNTDNYIPKPPDPFEGVIYHPVTTPNNNRNYERRCPDILAADLREELHKYIDSNVKDFILMSYDWIKKVNLPDGIQNGIAMLRYVEGNSSVDAVISNYIQCIPDANKNQMITSNKVNEKTLKSIFAYDSQITEELLNSEYDKFIGMRDVRDPQNILSLLSIDSYLLIMWYFAVCGNKDLYERARCLLSYFGFTIFYRDIMVSSKVCEYCWKINKGNSYVNNYDVIKDAINKFILESGT